MGKLAADVKQLKGWVVEGAEINSTWHQESWEDCAFTDGWHWSAKDKKIMLANEINPITTNKILPVVNLKLGYQANNPSEMAAKGRTQLDNEIGQVMTESIKYVMDRCEGQAKLQEAYKEQIITGFGFLKVDKEEDPRREPVVVRRFPWYTFGRDPYGDPWLDPLYCRYCFYYDWKDVDGLIAAFPEKEKEIEEEFRKMGTKQLGQQDWQLTYDVGSRVESAIGQMRGAAWADKVRRRVRPVEIYYTVDQDCLFAIMENSAVYEVKDSLPVNEQFQLLRQARQTVQAKVKKIRQANFMNDLILSDIESPHAHDMYPYIPFYSYLDRFNLPFGVPRNAKEQNMETNKRRSMALALLHSKRMIAEKGALEDPNAAFAEMNKRLGLIITNEGKMDKVKIDDLSDLADSQVALMNIAEREIKEITGANDESLGYETRVMSGTALEKKHQQSTTMSATLDMNFDRSKKKLGTLLIPEIQREWTGPKVLRVTDRMSGVDRFVEVNQQILNRNGDVIEVKNNIGNGLFDCVIAKKPLNDTIREQNAELLFNAINKAPPEAIPELLSMAFEMSDMPQKDMLLERLRRVLGVEEIDPMLSKEEQEAIRKDKQSALEAKASEDANYETKTRELDLQEREAKILKDKAMIEEMLIAAKIKERDSATKEFQEGFKLQQDLLRQRETRKPVEAK